MRQVLSTKKKKEGYRATFFVPFLGHSTSKRKNLPLIFGGFRRSNLGVNKKNNSSPIMGGGFCIDFPVHSSHSTHAYFEEGAKFVFLRNLNSPKISNLFFFFFNFLTISLKISTPEKRALLVNTELRSDPQTKYGVTKKCFRSKNA